MFDPTRESIAVTTVTACQGCGELFAFRLILTDAPLDRRQWHGWYVCERCQNANEHRQGEETAEITVEERREAAEAQPASER